MALDAALRVAQQYLHAFLAAQLLLVAALHAQFADVVAGPVIVVGLDVLGVHLAHVAQDVGGYGAGVLAYAAFLYVEAREEEYLFLEA